MCGLLATRALSDHFERVTVVERDVLKDGDDARKGVPQAVHAHGLMASGYRVMDAYFPGMMDELEALGAPRGDVVGDFLWFQYGRWKLRHRSGLRGITVSSPVSGGRGPPAGQGASQRDLPRRCRRRESTARRGHEPCDRIRRVPARPRRPGNPRSRSRRRCNRSRIAVGAMARDVRLWSAGRNHRQGRRRICHANIRAARR